MTDKKRTGSSALREILLRGARQDPAGKHIGSVAIVRTSLEGGANWSPIWVLKAAQHPVPAHIAQLVEQLQAEYDVDW